jgi:hypothetical protein
MEDAGRAAEKPARQDSGRHEEYETLSISFS